MNTDHINKTKVSYGNNLLIYKMQLLEKKLVQAKSDLHDGNINFNTQNKKLASMHIIVCIILSESSPTHHLQ
jgi:hypothetical protein